MDRVCLNGGLSDHRMQLKSKISLKAWRGFTMSISRISAARKTRAIKFNLQSTGRTVNDRLACGYNGTLCSSDEHSANLVQGSKG